MVLPAFLVEFLAKLLIFIFFPVLFSVVLRLFLVRVNFIFAGLSDVLFTIEEF